MTNQVANHTDYFGELCSKYSIQFADSNDQSSSEGGGGGGGGGGGSVTTNLNQKLEEIRNILRNELKKQYKLQEGAEKMRQATGQADKKSLHKLSNVIKETNLKIDELNRELLDLNSLLVISQTDPQINQQIDSFNDEHSPERNSFSNGSSNSSGRPSAENSQSIYAHKGRSSSTSGLNQVTNLTSNSNVNHTDTNTDLVRLTPHEQRIKALNRQLEIEMKIKVGAENMLQSFSQGPKKDKKLCDDAQAMLKDAKLKIEYIRMQLNKLNNQHEQYTMYGHHKNSEENIC